ncbi:metallophosphoesterase [Asaia sp. BMEF1]|uniref:metallophosphoesterase n=1 Tax=Asaia sp. BMEF1 TaxID=3155932 RepID=UPI003F67E3CC
MRLVIFGTFFLVVIANWLWPLPLSLPIRLMSSLLIIVAALYHQWCRLSSGSVLVPEMPRPLVILFNWAFGALLFLTVLQLVVDLAAVLIALIFWHPVQIGTEARIAIGGVAASLSAWGVRNALIVPPIRDIAVTLPGLSPAFNGFTLLQLSDLHITTLFPSSWVSAVVARANAAKADVIVVTGDFIDGSVSMRHEDIIPLSGLTARDGVYAIPGNHEYIFDYKEWMEALGTLGFDMLLNRHIVVRRDDAALVIAGVTDMAAGRHNEPVPDLESALEGCPPNAPVVLLDHQPGNARKAATRGIGLQLSGHTHGGMIRGLDRLVARANRGFVSGRYQLGGMTLYVSNGTGLWPGFALRLGCPAEITRVCLHAPSRTPT